MIYRKDSLSSTKTDEILIKQKQNNNDQRILVYKGYLKKGGKLYSRILFEINSISLKIHFHLNQNILFNILSILNFMLMDMPKVIC
jgi:hypothetical protein